MHNTAFTIINVLPNEYRQQNVDRIRKIVDLPEITDISLINGFTQGEDWLEDNRKESKILPGEMGAVASTVEVWKYMARSRYDEVLVFENDAILTEDFMQLFNRYRAQVPGDFDAFSLCAAERDKVKFDSDPKRFDIIGETEICLAYQNWPSNAILYTRKGAERALAAFEKVGRIEHTVDVWIYEHSGMSIYTLKPTAKRPVGRHLGQSTANPAWTGEGWPAVEW